MWTPNELTPIQEVVQISADFAPSTFHVFSAEEKGEINIVGKSDEGLTLAIQGDNEDDCVYVEEVRMKLQLLEKFNQSPFACKVIGILETDPNDPQTATKIVMESGDSEGVELMNFSEFIKDLSKGKYKNID